MTIAAVRLYHLVARLPEPIGNALITFQQRETLAVEVLDRDGTSGWGETWAEPEAAAAVISSRLVPAILGEDPLHIERLWRRMCGAGHASVSRMAVAALDMAIHDLAARRLGIPLSTLLGGAERNRVPAYASGPFFKPGGHPYRDYRRDIDSYLAEGFRAIKMRIGHDPRDDVALALDVRRQIGADCVLMVDFNQSVAPRIALETALRLEAAELAWIEEPALPGDLAGYRMLAGRLRPALAGGETFSSEAQFLPFLDAGCMDVLQPDITICGGLSGTRRVLALAELHRRPLLPHVWGSTINFHAALHLAASIPSFCSGWPASFPWIEYDVGPNPLLDVTGHPEVDRDGMIEVPSAPGLGIDLDRRRLEPFTVRFEEFREG